jgi:hypothetical protein
MAPEPRVTAPCRGPIRPPTGRISRASGGAGTGRSQAAARCLQLQPLSYTRPLGHAGAGMAAYSDGRDIAVFQRTTQRPIAQICFLRPDVVKMTVSFRRGPLGQG